MDHIFVYACGLGIAISAVPGMVAAEALRRGIAGGFWRAMEIQLGSIAGDVVWAWAALLGSAFLMRDALMLRALGVAGALALLYLAGRALADAWRGVAPAPKPERAGNFAAGFMLSVANPLAVPFWLGVCASGVAAAGLPRAESMLVFFIGFTAGACAWCFIFAAAIAWGRRYVGETIFRWINAACGVALAAFGVKLLAGAFGWLS